MILRKTIVMVSVIAITLILISWYKLRNNTIQNIYTTIIKYSLKDDIDNKNNALDGEFNNFIGSDELLKKINYFVQKNEPIVLTMVGFPYKSSNTKDKVLISFVDAAERFSLEYLQHFLDDIKTIYSPGARLYIFTDGIVFCDIEKVVDASVVKYEDDLKILAQDLADIQIITMRDLCPNKTSEEIRSLICACYPSNEEFQYIVDNDKKIQNDIDALADMMLFELAFLSLTNDEITAIGFQEIHRGLQFSTFLRQFRPQNAIYCSVRYQKDIGKKVGLKLSNSYVTPWHGVLVEVDNDECAIVHLRDINQSLYQEKIKKVNDLELVYLKRKTEL